MGQGILPSYRRRNPTAVLRNTSTHGGSTLMSSSPTCAHDNESAVDRLDPENAGRKEPLEIAARSENAKSPGRYGAHFPSIPESARGSRRASSRTTAVICDSMRRIRRLSQKNPTSMARIDR